jgi:hypothetical protein
MIRSVLPAAPDHAQSSRSGPRAAGYRNIYHRARYCVKKHSFQDPQAIAPGRAQGK